MLLADNHHPQVQVRQTCIERIGELLTTASDALREILPFLQDKSGEVRAATALAVVRIKADCTEAVEMLIPLLQYPHREARINAGIALATIGPPAQSALPALNTLATDPDEHIAGVAATAIKRIEGRL